LGNQDNRDIQVEMILKSVISRFDKYAQRRNERFLATLQKASPSEKEILNRAFRQGFLTNLSLCFLW
jgi:hypothetical protein